jgi:hypothetical protein
MTHARQRIAVVLVFLGTVAFVVPFLLPIGVSQTTTPQINISDVFGLQNELLLRPTMGLGYHPGTVTYVDAQGNLESVVGPAGNLVTVGGLSIPVASGTGNSINFVDGEIPFGPTNGSNTNFTLSHAPNPVGGLHLFRNGQRLNMPADYAVTGSTALIVFMMPPGANDTLVADYRY